MKLYVYYLDERDQTVYERTCGTVASALRRVQILMDRGRKLAWYQPTTVPGALYQHERCRDFLERHWREIAKATDPVKVLSFKEFWANSDPNEPPGFLLLEFLFLRLRAALRRKMKAR